MHGIASYISILFIGLFCFSSSLHMQLEDTGVAKQQHNIVEALYEINPPDDYAERLLKNGFSQTDSSGTMYCQEQECNEPNSKLSIIIEIREFSSTKSEFKKETVSVNNQSEDMQVFMCSITGRHLRVFVVEFTQDNENHINTVLYDIMRILAP